MPILKQYRINRTRALKLLNELELSTGTNISLYLPQGVTPAETAPYLKQLQPNQIITEEIVSIINNSRTGCAIFWGQTHQLLISPPFPFKEKYVTGGIDTAPLKAMLTHDWLIGLLLVRLGFFSIGVCKGETLLVHNTGTGLVHGRQRQGGSSSNRYRRRREEQTHHFLERVAVHAREKLEPYAKTIDYFGYGGARTTIMELRKHSRFLDQFDDRVLPPLLSIPDPRYEVLKNAVTEIWSSHVTEWREKDVTG